MNIVPLRQCKCGAPGNLTEICLRGRAQYVIAICSDCRAEGEDFLDRMKPVFEAMIAVGVNRDVANQTMTFMLDRM